MSDDKLLELIRGGNFGFADDLGPLPVHGVERREEEPEEDRYRQQVVAGVQFLTFFVGEQTYAVPLDQVQTVLNVGVISRYPASQSFVLGGFQLRNEVLPLIGLSAVLNEEEQGVMQKILVLEQAPRRLGFAVRGIRRAQMIPYAQLAPVGEDLKASTGYLFDAIADLEEETVLVLSPQALFARLGVTHE